MKNPEPKPHLAYTVAIDPPHSPGHRFLAKLLASSLLRTSFQGDIVIFRNTDQPLFQVAREGLTEIKIETPDYSSPLNPTDMENAWRYKFRVRHFLDVEGYDKVLFLDADCLAIQNICPLLDGDWDIGWFEEVDRPITLKQFHCFLTDKEMQTCRNIFGANSGTLAVRAECYHEVMEMWERIDLGAVTRERHCSDQASWNRLLLDTDLERHKFDPSLVKFPLFLHPNFHDWKDASLVHAVGGDTREKMKFLWGLYMQTFYFDDAGTLFNLLEI